MRASDDDYWYPDDDAYSEGDETDDEECIFVNYDDFLKYQDESSLWSPTDESQDEDFDYDESNAPGHSQYCQEFYTPGSESEPAVRGKHSCLRTKDGYYYLDPNVYDTRVMRNLTTVDDDYPCENYSPKFIQAALEKTRSSTSWSNGLRAMVENLIDNTQVVIFSKTYCPYCVTAKEIFEDMDQPYTVIELDRRADGDEIQDIMEEITGGRSVPRVFVDGMFIGGGDDVSRLYESGELQEMLDFG